MRFLPLLAVLACVPEQGASFEAESLTATAVAAWLAGDLMPVTDGPQTSVGAPGADIVVWTRPDDVERYQTISAHAAGSGAELGIGAMVVREVLDEDGELEKVTVIAKAPLEVHEALGGWVFGVYSPMGEVLADEEGVLAGALPACTGCHLARVDDDFLFGLP